MIDPMDLAGRYEKDPVFHVLVDLLSAGGFADDDGVAHPGPSVADGHRAMKFLERLEENGLVLVWKSDWETERRIVRQWRAGHDDIGV